MATLYFHPLSSCSRRVILFVDIHTIEVDRHLVKLDQGEQYSTDYRAINPNHQVPTWVDEDIVLHESHAILRYLCNRHELDHWYPRELFVRAAVDQWLDWTTCRFARAEADVVFNTCFAGDKADSLAIERGKCVLDQLYPILESVLGCHRFLTGDRPTIADISLAASIIQLSLAQVSVDGKNLADWFERMKEIPGFCDALPAPNPAIA